MSPRYLKRQRKGIYNFSQSAFITQQKCVLHFKSLVSESTKLASDNKLKNGFSKRLFCLSAGLVIKLGFKRNVGFRVW